MPRPWPHLGMQAAGAGPLCVHCATTGLCIQKLTIPIRTARQGEDAVLEVEMRNLARLAEALGDFLRLFVLGLKGIDQLQTHQIRQLDLHRHGAAVGRAAVA